MSLRRASDTLTLSHTHTTSGPTTRMGQHWGQEAQRFRELLSSVVVTSCWRQRPEQLSRRALTLLSAEMQYSEVMRQCREHRSRRQRYGQGQNWRVLMRLVHRVGLAQLSFSSLGPFLWAALSRSSPREPEGKKKTILCEDVKTPQPSVKPRKRDTLFLLATRKPLSTSPCLLLGLDGGGCTGQRIRNENVHRQDFALHHITISMLWGIAVRVCLGPKNKKKLICSTSAKPHPYKPQPLRHATSENRGCAAIFRKLKVVMQKLHCNIVRCNIEELRYKKLPLSCRFQAVTFTLPRLGPADLQT